MTEEEFDYSDDDFIDEDDIGNQIDGYLDTNRPDRYNVEGVNWLDRVAEHFAPKLPEQQVRQMLARRLVGQRESLKLKKGNRVLRQIYEDGQPPLFWLNEPISVNKERVTLRAASSGDLRTFEAEERRRSMRDQAVRNITCDGAAWLADQMDAQGVSLPGDVRWDDKGQAA